MQSKYGWFASIAVLAALITWLLAHSTYTAYDRVGNGIYGLRDVETVYAAIVGISVFLLVSIIARVWSSLWHRRSLARLRGSGRS